MQEAERPMFAASFATPISIAVVEYDNRFLIGKRPEGVALAGLWEFPGGKIRKGEAPNECAARECLEETGVAVKVLGQHSERVHAYDHGAVHLHFYLCSPLDPRQPPRAPFRWVERRSLVDYEFPPANAELIASLLRSASPSKR